MDKNYRIHTNIANDTVLNVNMQQDYDFLEVLTIKLRQKDAYRLHSSNYGVIIGRVLANDAFGIPNAKISVFIERDTNDSVDIENIYPYSDVTSKDRDGRRYNLLPDYSNDDCYRIVGTFPNKRLLLDNDIQLEIYDKYWKYTTVSNNAGDYMIFGVPSGSQQIHVDIDLSDIGILSQKPRDFEYKGYNLTMFDNPNQFKESTNLDSLTQLFSQDKSVFVYPFWGDDDNGVAAITRADIQIQYKFEPTCVFMGSIVSDNEGHSIGHKCAPDIDNGMNDQLVTGGGTIEMIRKTQDGFIEEYQIQGNQLIDDDGVWCYQIPMNLDFIGTDEYGNIVPTDNPSKGIPTRTQVRFRISKNDSGDEGFSNHTAKYLVPMNPIFSEKAEVESIDAEVNPKTQKRTLNGIQPVIESRGQDIENMYNFGSNTPQSCFRDLYWNNVYSVKNYIPKTQIAHRPYSKNYSALKGSNLAGDKNPIPFNKLRIDLPFVYVIVCIIYQIIIWIVSIINRYVICLINIIIEVINAIIDAINDVTGLFGLFGNGLDIGNVSYIGCISLGEGLDDRYIFVPGCGCDSGQDAVHNPYGLEPYSDTELLDNLVVERLAEDYNIIKLDLYQDWLNGCLYMPLWYWKKRKKKSYLFGLITRSAKNEFCDCNRTFSRLRTYVTCNLKYLNNSLGVGSGQVPPDDTDWHKKKTDRVQYANGLIKGVENKDGLTAYYYVATQATRDNAEEELDMAKRTEPFYAIRLYATDIILLGNLNEDNLYGIPQFFKVLPSTTANVPPIATIEENNVPDSNDEEYDYNEKNEIYTQEDSGTTIITGMNWRHKGADEIPAYTKGLFMELACTAAYTKAKSCFNVERLSELGVNNDMSYTMRYNNGGSEIQSGVIFPDGFISKLELDDMENRAMFATMNHIGFVPQEYQNSISGYTTQVEDENTSYLVPKFRYIYPVDFDGRQQELMRQYKKGFGQHMFDEIDESYLTFRLGADSEPNDGENNRMRHFYHVYDDGYSMPVYNNSFYFYFGVNKGSTAIDKFNKMFYSECFKNEKKPFYYEIETRGLSECGDIYNNENDRYAYIKFSSDDIQTPFSYALYDSFAEEIISEEEMNKKTFVIGGRWQSGAVVTNDDGKVLFQNKEEDAICVEDEAYVVCSAESGTNFFNLSSTTYVLDVTDANGKTLSDEITLSHPVNSFSYTTRGLGTKFYNIEINRIDNICNKYNDLYGLIDITGFFIDGYEFTINDASCTTSSGNSSTSSGNSKYYVRVTGSPKTNSATRVFKSNVVVDFEIQSITDETSGGTKYCMCDRDNRMDGSKNIDIDYFEYISSAHTFEFRVYRPLSYLVSMTLVCNDVPLSSTTISQIITVPNGEKFDVTLNDMPVRFMIGTVSDGDDGRIAEESNFYSSAATANAKGDDIKGWYGLHDEETYKFSGFPTTTANDLVWSEYVRYETITSPESRKQILLYKFDKMFGLSNTGYMTSNSRTDYMYMARGGVAPILYRVLSPIYDNFEGNIGDNWKYSDRNSVNNYSRVPNIVGENYCWTKTKNGRGIFECDTPISPNDSPTFNGIFRENRQTTRNKITNYVGNYFAAFTNNGRYLKNSLFTGDCSSNTVQIPTKAATNLDNGWKVIGEDRIYSYVSFTLGDVVLKRAHTEGNDGACGDKTTLPHLRAMYVDRRLDYDLIAWLPTVSYSKLYPTVEGISEDKNIPVNSTRISGITYNGIEMAYDDLYNVISANTSSAGTATPNNRLDYSYSVSSGENENAFTVYNKPEDSELIVWKGEDGDGPFLKTLHTARINDSDIRNYFWSDFNKTKLINLVNSHADKEEWLYDSGSTYYIYTHSNNQERTLYNGYFDENNYPSRRLIDIGNIRGEGMFNLSLASCSYNMSPTYKYGEISCKTKKGDNLSISIYPQDIITFIPPSADNKEVANITFTMNGTDDGYTVFSASKALLSFKFNKTTTGNFNVYPQWVRLIKVLSDDMPNSTKGNIKTDGLTYIKTPSTEDNLFSDRLDVRQRINKITIKAFVDRCEPFNWVIGTRSCDFSADDMSEWRDIDAVAYKRYSEQEGGNMGYYMYNGKWMTLNHNKIDAFTFYKEVSLSGDTGRTYAFTVLNTLDYYDKKDIYHTKHLLVYQTSQVFDARDVQLRIDPTQTNVTLHTTRAYTEVEHVDVTVDVDVSVSGTTTFEISGETVSADTTASGGGGGDGSGSGHGHTDFQTFYQNIAFAIRMEKDGVTNPNEMVNQMFASSNGALMGYTLVFTSTNGEKEVTLSPKVTVKSSPKELILKAQFQPGDGILFDEKEWGTRPRVAILLKTYGFVYKVGEFKLNIGGQDGSYDSTNRRFNCQNCDGNLSTTVEIVQE